MLCLFTIGSRMTASWASRFAGVTDWVYVPASAAPRNAGADPAALLCRCPAEAEQLPLTPGLAGKPGTARQWTLRGGEIGAADTVPHDFCSVCVGVVDDREDMSDDRAVVEMQRPIRSEAVEQLTSFGFSESLACQNQPRLTASLNDHGIAIGFRYRDDEIFDTATMKSL